MWTGTPGRSPLRQSDVLDHRIRHRGVAACGVLGGRGDRRAERHGADTPRAGRAVPAPSRGESRPGKDARTALDPLAGQPEPATPSPPATRRDALGRGYGSASRNTRSRRWRLGAAWKAPACTPPWRRSDATPSPGRGPGCGGSVEPSSRRHLVGAGSRGGRALEWGIRCHRCGPGRTRHSARG